MTTLVQVRKPLQAVSMSSNQPERKPGKRPPAPVDDSSDDDFKFERKTKKPKTDDSLVRKSMSGKAAAKAIGVETDDSFTEQRQPSRRQTTAQPFLDSSPDIQVAKRDQRKSSQRPEDRHAGNKSRSRPPPDDDSFTETSQSTMVPLPLRDTPVINRNKEMRKQGGSSRRSSLTSRGRRASLLMDQGQASIPHREVDASVFYKHIQAYGWTEQQRMKQLLTWCGSRALPEKPPHDAPNRQSLLAARPIQDQILKGFGETADFSDWLSRDDSRPRKPLLLKPNPKNVELDQKMDDLEARIKRLQEEKQAWLSIRKPPVDQPPVFASDNDAIILPDFDLLDPEERKIRTYLASEMEPFASVRKSTDARIRKIQESLEFEVDQLADNVHKLEQRVLVASQEADKVLASSAVQLKAREEKEKTRAGTRAMPMMEVLRSLGKILPDGGV